MAGILAVIFWSLSGLMASLSGSMPTFQLMLYSSTLTVFYYLIYWLLTLLIKGENTLKQSKLFSTAFLWVLAGIFGYLSFYYTAFKYAPALHVNSLNYLWPILTAIIAQLLFKELQFNLAALFWLLLAFIGTIGILTSVNLGAEHIYPNIILGYGFAITAAIIWAVYNNITRTIHFKVENMAGIFFANAVLSFFLHHIFENSHSPNQTQWIGIIGLSIINLGYVAWDYALKDIKLNFILGIAYFIPVFSTLILLLYSNTGFSLQFILSSSLIFIAAYFMSRSAIKIS